MEVAFGQTIEISYTHEGIAFFVVFQTTIKAIKGPPKVQNLVSGLWSNILYMQ